MSLIHLPTRRWPSRSQPGQLCTALNSEWEKVTKACDRTCPVHPPPPSLAVSVSVSSSSPVIRVMMRDSLWSEAQYQPQLIDNLLSVQCNHIIWRSAGWGREFNLGWFVSSGAISRCLGSRTLLQRERMLRFFLFCRCLTHSRPLS